MADGRASGVPDLRHKANGIIIAAANRNSCFRSVVSEVEEGTVVENLRSRLYTMRRDAPRVAAFDENTCPVPDAILSRLYRAQTAEIQAIAIELPEPQRIQLAVFCYARSHLREVGRDIAALCNGDTIVNVVGRGLASSIGQREHGDRPRFVRPTVTLATPKDMGAPLDHQDDLGDDL